MKLWIAVLWLSLLALPATAQRLAEACVAEGTLPAEIGTVLPDGTITLKDGLLLRLAGIVWPDRIELSVQEKLARGLKESLSGQRVTWRAAGGPDRWGIVPAHLFVQEPETGGQMPLPPFWLQAGMVEAGLVPAWPEGVAGSCWETLLGHEAIAVQRRRGHWAPRVQAQRMARIGANPVEHAGRRVVTLWRVSSARAWRDLYFLNVAGRGRDGPAVSLAPATISALTARGDAPEHLGGKQVIARFVVPAEGLRRARIESADHLQIRR